jgi:hypothetical protein
MLQFQAAKPSPVPRRGVTFAERRTRDKDDDDEYMVRHTQHTYTYISPHHPSPSPSLALPNQPTCVPLQVPASSSTTSEEDPDAVLNPEEVSCYLYCCAQALGPGPHAHCC